VRFRRSDPHTLAAAYAMDAVPRPDEARFERHLAGCDSCRQEVRGLREATAALAAAAAVDPPAAFRDAALRAAAQTRQLPPADSASPARWAAFRERRRSAEGYGRSARGYGRPARDYGRSARSYGRSARDYGLAAGGYGHPGEGSGDRRSDGSSGRPGWLGRLGWRGWVRWVGWVGWLGWRSRLVVALACVLAAVAVAAGVTTYGMQDRLDQAQRRDLTVAAVLTASDATMMSAHVTTGGTATVVMSHRERALVFTAADLRALPGARAYELWLMGPAGTRPAGMITVSGHGRMVGPMVVSGLAVGDKVGLTVEPAAGSPRPTSTPVLMLSLTFSS
jgi:anti-sigma-K factor RskA